MTSSPSQILNTRKEWRDELEKLPTLEENGGKIPSVFLAHGREFSSFVISRFPLLAGPDSLILR